MPEDINLLPQQTAEEKPQNKTNRLLNTASVFIIIITAVAAAGLMTARLGLEAQAANTEKQISDQKDKISSYHDAEGTYLLLQNKLAHAQKFLASQPHFSQFLAGLNRTIPTSVTFTDLSVEKGGQVTINGSTTSYGDLSGFFNEIQTASDKTLSRGTSDALYFANPSLTNISRNAQTGQITFSMKFTINPTLLAAPVGGAK